MAAGASGAAAASGISGAAAAGSSAAGCSSAISLAPKDLCTISFASRGSIALINSLSTRPSILRSNLMLTSDSLVSEKMSLTFSVVSRISGGEILTTCPRKDANALAADPIIWFMISQMALMLISSSSTISEGSMDSRCPSIFFRSSSFNSKMLVPSIPSIYLIKTPITGSR